MKPRIVAFEKYYFLFDDFKSIDDKILVKKVCGLPCLSLNEFHSIKHKLSLVAPIEKPSFQPNNAITADFIEVKTKSHQTNDFVELKSLSESKRVADIVTEPEPLWLKLKQQGKWIVDGLKFGGDYLIYDDDPATCHASAIVKQFKNETYLDLVLLLRLAKSVKKTLILHINDQLISLDYFIPV